MEEDIVSIIMPTYNADDVLENAIESVEKQTYTDWELLVIENGKKGKAEEICKKFANKKIKYIYEEIANVSVARNIGVDNATGKYIAFLDADDKYEKNFLEEMIKNVKANNSELVACGYSKVFEKSQMLIENYSEIEKTDDIKKYIETLKENYLYNELWNKLYITEIIKKHNIKFNKDYELGEDFLFNLDYTKYINKASYINLPLYVYTDGQTGLKLKYRKDKFQIEHSLTEYLENFYKEKGWNLDYIYNRYARVYYNQIIDIYKPNNQITKKEKDEQLKEAITQEQYKKELQFLKDKVTDKKFKIAIRYFFLKGEKRIKLFIFLNNIRKK